MSAVLAPHELGDEMVIRQAESFRGIRGLSTWCVSSGGRAAYLVEAPHEDVARWIGFMLAEEEGLDVTWHGTRRTPTGSFVAQFTGEETSCYPKT